MESSRTVHAADGDFGYHSAMCILLSAHDHGHRFQYFIRFDSVMYSAAVDHQIEVSLKRYERARTSTGVQTWLNSASTRKLALGGVFGLGVFVVCYSLASVIYSVSNASPLLTRNFLRQILAAILNRYYNFTEPYGSLVYLNWYVGEAATAVCVANIPLCWPLLRRVLNLSAFTGPSRLENSVGLEFSSRMSKSNPRSQVRSDQPWYERGESEERIEGTDAAIATSQLFVKGTPVDARYKYRVTAMGGQEEGESNGSHSDGAQMNQPRNILRTVQIQQKYG